MHGQREQARDCCRFSSLKQISPPAAAVRSGSAEENDNQLTWKYLPNERAPPQHLLSRNLKDSNEWRGHIHAPDLRFSTGGAQGGHEQGAFHRLTRTAWRIKYNVNLLKRNLCFLLEDRGSRLLTVSEGETWWHTYGFSYVQPAARMRPTRRFCAAQ